MWLNQFTQSLVVVALILSSSSIQAAASNNENDGLPEWELGVGVATYNLPAYRGSDDRTTTVLPFPYVIYRGERFRINRSIQGILFETDQLTLDISGRASPFVESDDSEARRDMPDLDPTIEVGPSLTYLLTDPDNPQRFTLGLAARAVASVDFGDLDISQQGWVFEPSIGYQQPVADMQFSAQTGVLFATQAYHDYFYSVSAESTTATRPEFDSDSGYSGAYLTASLNGRYKQLRWGVFARYDNLHGAAFEDSPLVENKDDFIVGASVAWVFGQSKRRVQIQNTGPGAVFEIPLFGQ